MKPHTYLKFHHNNIFEYNQFSDFVCFVATHENAKIQVCFCTFVTIGAIVIW